MTRPRFLSRPAPVLLVLAFFLAVQPLLAQQAGQDLGGIS
jgi:hypothetical protein